jgi:uncharacterized lipoprotein YddW (UPF0748 family)
MRQYKGLFLSILFSLSLAISILISHPTQAATPPEFRGFWVDAYNPGLKTPQQISQLVADAKRANANAILAQVRRRGDAYYLSNIEPRTTDETLTPGFDPLQDLIDKAHAAGIEVHAWLVALPVYRQKTSPEVPTHVWQKHGPHAPLQDNWAMLTYGGEAPGYLDPGHPDAADYTVSVYLEVLKNYDVDGLHLDYIRYEDQDYGYNPTSVARFNAFTGQTGIPQPTNPAWMQWRRDQVTNLVRKLYIESLAIKPNVKISAAVIAWGNGPKTEADWYKSSAYTKVFQDWQSWLQEGIIDIAMPMVYMRGFNPQQQQWYDDWVEFASDHQYNRYIMIGAGAYLNPLEDTLNQIRRAQTPSRKGNLLQGQLLFSYAASHQDAEGNPQSNQLTYTALSQPLKSTNSWGQTSTTQPVWLQPASVPELPWKTHPQTGAIQGQIELCQTICNPMNLTLTRQIGAGGTYQLKTDGKGWFGAVEIPEGVYDLAVNLADENHSEDSHKIVTIDPGKVTTIHWNQDELKSS